MSCKSKKEKESEGNVPWLCKNEEKSLLCVGALLVCSIPQSYFHIRASLTVRWAVMRTSLLEQCGIEACSELSLILLAELVMTLKFIRESDHAIGTL